MKNKGELVASRPIKVTVTRLEEIFEQTMPCFDAQKSIIKDYVYSNKKRVLA